MDQALDELIGKYGDLDIQRVIAVSNTTFSEGALQKAKARHIDTLTLREAMDTDWTQEIIRLGWGLSTRTDKIVGLRVVTDPPPLRRPSEDDNITNERGVTVISLFDAARAIFDKQRHEITRQINEKLPELFSTLGDLATREARTELKVTPPAWWFLKQKDDSQYLIKQIVVKVVSTFTFEPGDIAESRLGDARISRGTLQLDNDSAPIDITAVQSPERPRQIRIAIRPSKVKKPRKKQ